MMLSGVFERFPNLKFVMTEQGCAWLPPLLDQLDMIIKNVRENRRDRRAAVQARARPPEVGHGVLPAERLDGRELPPAGRRGGRPRRRSASTRFMWGSDYPHDEGTYPFTTEALRQLFSDWPEADLRRILAGNAAEAYGFDLRSSTRPRPGSAPGSPRSPGPSTSCRRMPTRPCSATLPRPERPSRP